MGGLDFTKNDGGAKRALDDANLLLSPDALAEVTALAKAQTTTSGNKQITFMEANKKKAIGDVVQNELLNKARQQMQAQGTGLSGNSRGVGFAGQTNSTPTSLLARGRTA